MAFIYVGLSTLETENLDRGRLAAGHTDEQLDRIADAFAYAVKRC